MGGLWSGRGVLAIERKVFAPGSGLPVRESGSGLPQSKGVSRRLRQRFRRRGNGRWF